MTEVYIATIQPFAFQWAPRGWISCAGQIMSIAQNTAVFSLIGTTYGGDGINTFAIPDLRGRAAINQGHGPGLSNYVLGEMVGTESVTILSTNMPAHTHPLMASTTTAVGAAPGTNEVLAASTGSDNVNGDAVNVLIYGPPAGMTMLSPQSIGISGGSLPMSILSPTLTINYCFAMEGIYPSRP